MIREKNLFNMKEGTEEEAAASSQSTRKQDSRIILRGKSNHLLTDVTKVLPPLRQVTVKKPVLKTEVQTHFLLGFECGTSPTGMSGTVWRGSGTFGTGALAGRWTQATGARPSEL